MNWITATIISPDLLPDPPSGPAVPPLESGPVPSVVEPDVFRTRRRRAGLLRVARRLP